MADKNNAIATDPGTGTKESLEAKRRQAKEAGWELDRLEDDEVREALELLHARAPKTTSPQG